MTNEALKLNQKQNEKPSTYSTFGFCHRVKYQLVKLEELFFSNINKYHYVSIKYKSMEFGYFGSNSATHFGLSVPVIPVLTVPPFRF